MKSFRIQVFTRNGCKLCEDVKDRVLQVAEDIPIELEMVDITQDEALLEKYDWYIPVVHIDGEEVFVSRMSEMMLRYELQRRMNYKETNP